MNGEQKTWVLVSWAIATVVGWLTWNVANYYTRALDSRPSTSAVLSCVDQCAVSCAAAVEEDRE